MENNINLVLVKIFYDKEFTLYLDNKINDTNYSRYFENYCYENDIFWISDALSELEKGDKCLFNKKIKEELAIIKSRLIIVEYLKEDKTLILLNSFTSDIWQELKNNYVEKHTFCNHMISIYWSINRLMGPTSYKDDPIFELKIINAMKNSELIQSMIEQK